MGRVLNICVICARLSLGPGSFNVSLLYYLKYGMKMLFRPSSIAQDTQIPNPDRAQFLISPSRAG